MTINIDRRLLIQLGTFGLGAVAASVSTSAASAISGGKGFSHGVASGEPSQNSVLLWTRYTGAEGAKLAVEISADADFTAADPVGEVAVSAARDFTAKFVVDDLQPNQWYFFRFVAPDGSKSAVGRTRTLPEGKTEKFNIGVVGCSNMPFGYFNAYAHAAQNNGLDLVVHTGDYLYEYGPGIYPPKKSEIAGRVPGPAHEIIQLADYRLRYAAYRKDPDLQRLHQVLPMIAMWDDHEFANDAYKDGAENHSPETEGDWEVRKRVAEQVYREWMPVSDRAAADPLYAKYEIGDLATLFLTESRIGGRDKPAELEAALKGKADIAGALKEFRDGEWQDPSRQMLGAAQEKWLGEAMKKSVANGTKWQVMAQQCVMGELHLPQDAASWVAADAPAIAKARVAIGALAARTGLPLNFDSWDGYPQARERLLKGAQEADANLVVLSGDSHNAWAFDLQTADGAAGVEFAGQSVTSPGFEAYTAGVAPATVAKAVIETNNQLQWADTEHRGYMTVSLTPEKATSTWHFLDTIRQKSIALSGEKSQTVLRGANKLG
ncbi:alkaline phosphatase D family protein [Parasphingorhabdus halotolerans]|uniref:Alkaline phosphatase D family protein n=1 Tax=Parasphingorhabdus halotolerans TaxID=2725558 RepID=A0A6H2DLQ7_9SPHN|nr:alkaline phosphatase D family protein [Parasphingorhabdus halotolerans]QJB69284.1 alkaline phosphatase D family protein [Parasphingorhabdus halotolerans]